MAKQTEVHPYHGILHSNKRNKLLTCELGWISRVLRWIFIEVEDILMVVKN